MTFRQDKDNLVFYDELSHGLGQKQPVGVATMQRVVRRRAETGLVDEVAYREQRPLRQRWLAEL